MGFHVFNITSQKNKKIKNAQVMCRNCVYEKLLHIEFLFHSRWLKKKIQTTKFNNPIGLNLFLKVYT